MLKFIQKTALLSLLLLLISANTTFASEPPANIKAILHDNTPLNPAKVFDNVYCIGTKSVVAWAIKTEEGIILIDSMWDDNDAKTIINGLTKLGLNPEEIKYVIVTHGHGDHYGGANFIRNKYNAKVVMTKVDENLMNTVNTGANSSRSPKTPVDIYVKDGDKITLGKTTVEILETPGHTPGGISLIFPTTNDGKKEVDDDSDIKETIRPYTMGRIIDIRQFFAKYACDPDEPSVCIRFSLISASFLLPGRGELC